ncbi:DUF4326 domain-containing protein [Pseudomonas sp. TYF_14]|uniref:DUF4326 domain-containing protein n=1 Tax=Pseudomonas sp. TYF_14 TaxID=3367193 RepID=UPI00370C1290
MQARLGGGSVFVRREVGRKCPTQRAPCWFGRSSWLGYYTARVDLMLLWWYQELRWPIGCGFLKASENREHDLGIIRRKVILCHCKPAACHGDVLAAHLNAQDDDL